MGFGILLLIGLVSASEQAPAPQRQAAGDKLTITVLEQNGQPSPARPVSLLTLNQIVLDPEPAPRTDAQGQAVFDWAEAQRAAQAFTQTTRVKLWVVGPWGNLLEREFDLASTREITVTLPPQRRLTLRLDDFPPEVYPRLRLADREDPRLDSQPGYEGDDLGDGRFRFDGIPLGEDWTVEMHRRWATDYRYSHAPVDPCSLADQRVRGPGAEEEQVERCLRLDQGPLLRGRFVDEQGEPLPFSSFASWGLELVGEAAGDPETRELFYVEAFADGQFVAGPVYIEGRPRLESLPALDRWTFRWDPGKNEGAPSEAHPYFELDARLKAARGAVQEGPLAVGTAVTSLGEVRLSTSGPLLRLRVVDEAGQPIEGASVAVAVADPERDWGERRIPGWEPRTTGADGVAAYFGASWRSVLAPTRAPDRALPSQLKVLVDCQGFVRRELVLAIKSSASDIVLEKGAILRGSLTLRDGRERFRTGPGDSFRLHAVDPGEALVGKEGKEARVYAEYVLRMDRESRVDFTFRELPRGPVDLVLTTNGGDFELLRFAEWQPGGPDLTIDLDADLDWARLRLFAEDGRELGPEDPLGYLGVRPLHVTVSGSPYLSLKWQEGRLWVPVPRLGRTAPLVLRLSGFIDEELPLLTPGEHRVTVRRSGELTLVLNGLRDQELEARWRVGLLALDPGVYDRPQELRDPSRQSAAERRSPRFGDILPGAYEVSWWAPTGPTGWGEIARSSIQVSADDLQVGSRVVLVPDEVHAALAMQQAK